MKASKHSDPNYIPRPQNAFIFFRRDFVSKHARSNSAAVLAPDSLTRESLSKRAGNAWRLLPEPEKKHYQDLAKQAELDHKLMYPNYVYRPRRFKHHHCCDTPPPPPPAYPTHSPPRYHAPSPRELIEPISKPHSELIPPMHFPHLNVPFHSPPPTTTTTTTTTMRPLDVIASQWTAQSPSSSSVAQTSDASSWRSPSPYDPPSGPVTPIDNDQPPFYAHDFDWPGVQGGDSDLWSPTEQAQAQADRDLDEFRMGLGKVQESDPLFDTFRWEGLDELTGFFDFTQFPDC